MLAYGLGATNLPIPAGLTNWQMKGREKVKCATTWQEVSVPSSPIQINTFRGDGWQNPTVRTSLLFTVGYVLSGWDH